MPLVKHMKPEDAWGWYWQNRANLQINEAVLAEDTTFKMSVCFGESSNSIYPEVRFYSGAGCAPHAVREVLNRDDFVRVATRYIETYLEDDDAESKSDADPGGALVATSDANHPVSEEEEEPDLTQDEMIYQREDELSCAMADFLATVLLEDDGVAVKEAYGEKMVEECVEALLEFVFENYATPIYRPMYLENPETLETEFVEYPYGEFE